MIRGASKTQEYYTLTKSGILIKFEDVQPPAVGYFGHMKTFLRTTYSSQCSDKLEKTYCVYQRPILCMSNILFLKFLKLARC